MKRIAIICLAAFMLAVLSSCGGEQKQNDKQEQSGETEVLETTVDTTADDGWSEIYRP